MTTLRSHLLVLIVRTMSADVLIAQHGMLGQLPTRALTPGLETACTQMAAHQFDDTRLIQSELVLNRLKRGAILPGHFDYPRNIRRS